MRSIVRTGIVLGVVALAVGGITFIRSGSPTREAPREETLTEAKHGPSGVATAPPLRDTQVIFPVVAAPGGQESEHRVGGHFDFWFQNPNDYDVEMGVEAKSCKCARLEMLNLEEGEERALRELLPSAALADCLAGTAGLLPYLTTVGSTQMRVYPFMAAGPRWRDLIVADKEGLPVRKKSTGFVRMIWDGRDQDPHRIGAQVWVQHAGDPDTRGGWTNLEIPVNIVPSLRVWPTALRLADMDSTSPVASAEFYAWSSTRADMTVLARESTGDPAFTCVLEPLTGPEFRAAAAWLAKTMETEDRGDFEAKTDVTVPLQPMLLYRVKVIVHDQPPQAPLDWGLFRRDITVTSDLGLMSIVVPITGHVHGPLKVPPQVELETFPARDGKTAATALSSNVPGISLQIESRTPGYLEADLKESKEDDGTSRWDLTVRVPPNRLMGALPHDSAIVLKVLGSGSRRIRIPVQGKGVISSSGS